MNAYINRIAERILGAEKDQFNGDLDFMDSVLQLIEKVPSPAKEQLFLNLILLRDRETKKRATAVRAA
jgi:hypothetical protein